MKKSLLIGLISLFALNCFSQTPINTIEQVFQNFQRDRITETPFYATRSYQEPYVRPSMLPLDEWKGQIKMNAWKDWQLTEPMEFYEPEVTMHRFFKPDNSKFVIAVMTIGNPLQRNDYMITATPSGGYIDNIEVEFGFDGRVGRHAKLKQWIITADMDVIVYQIIPEKNMYFTTPENLRDPSYKFECPPFKGTRIDTTYEIGSDGKFKKIKEVAYKPEIYTLKQLADLDKNIWEGKEQIDSTQKF